MVLNDREKLKPGGLSLGSSEWITSSGFEKASSGFDYKKKRVGFSKNVKNMCFSNLFLLRNNYTKTWKKHIKIMKNELKIEKKMIKNETRVLKKK